MLSTHSLLVLVEKSVNFNGFKSNSVKQIFAVMRVEMKQITSRLIKCKICISRRDFDSFQLLKSESSTYLTLSARTLVQEPGKNQILNSCKTKLKIGRAHV